MFIYKGKSADELTIQDVQEMATKIDNEEYVEHTCKELFRELHEYNTPSIQSVTTLLEKYKRCLGRQFDKSKQNTTAVLYNEVELALRWLTTNFKTTRKTKPHYLKIQM